MVTNNHQPFEILELMVQVKDDLVLNAGKVTVESDRYILTPPETSLFDQLWNWLAEHPRRDYGIHNYALGIGATALCFRWGTYLSVLMDENKPIDPRAAEGNISMISNREMKRINIEASYNLAFLFEKMHSNENETLDFILRAYDWLPMPHKRIKPDWKNIRTIYAFLASYKNFVDPFYQERSEQAIKHPYRALANVLSVLAYRNGDIENVHAGEGAAYPLTHRRFTFHQSRDILRGTAEHLSAALAAKPAWDSTLPNISEPWPQRLAGLPYITFYPWDWSLDQSSASVTLLKEWCQ